MPIWYNQDGLLIKSGRDEAVTGTAGTYVDYVTGSQILDISVDLTKLSTTPLILDDFIHFPKGWLVEQVDLYVEVGAVGGTSLSVGLVSNDRVTVIDNAAFLNAVPTANMGVGRKTTYRVGDTGAGTRMTGKEVIPGTYVTGTVAGTFTAGLVKVRIHYRRP